MQITGEAPEEAPAGASSTYEYEAWATPDPSHTITTTQEYAYKVAKSPKELQGRRLRGVSACWHYPAGCAACLELIGVDDRILVRIDHGPVNYRGHGLVLGDGRAIRRYDGPSGFALRVIQGLTFFGGLDACHANQDGRACQNC